jgi:hypothetical protein
MAGSEKSLNLMLGESFSELKKEREKSAGGTSGKSRFPAVSERDSLFFPKGNAGICHFGWKSPSRLIENHSLEFGSRVP